MIILAPPDDPTDMVIAGEQMRSVAFDSPVAMSATVLAGAASLTDFSSRITDEDIFLPMNSFVEGNRLGVTRSKYGQLLTRAGAGVATTFGAWVWLDYTPLLSPLLWASNLFAISGVTKDSAGAALGDCRVVAFESGRIAADTIEAEVGETMSDGSGNFSVSVPLNTAYQLTAYKPGSPDVAGITRNDVVPTHVG